MKQAITEQTLADFKRRYSDQFEALEKNSPLGQLKKLGNQEFVALGQQLAMFESYMKYIQETEGTLKDLGQLPKVALDVITAVAGSSILPIISSTQPIDEQIGMVYYRKTVAANSRGNITEGDVLQDPRVATGKKPLGFAGQKSRYATVNTVADSASLTGTCPNYPVSVNTIRIDIPLAAGALWAIDDGDGNLLGKGCSGTINYSTGAWTLTLAAVAGEVKPVTVTYGADFESGATIGRLTSVQDSTSIEAEIFALEAQVGFFKQFAMQKRFGDSAQGELLKDLTNAINSELGYTALDRLLDGVGYTTIKWDKTAHTGFSYMEHKDSLNDKLAEVEGLIQTQSGKGNIDVLIAGLKASRILTTVNGFEAKKIVSEGPQVAGTLKGRTVIQSNSLPTNAIFGVCRGAGAFDAPLVYAPYMPLFVGDTIPTPTNILLKKGFAAIWAGLKRTNANYVAGMSIDNIDG